MNKLLIHLGMPKAASTSLQKHIFSNIEGENVRFTGKHSTHSSSYNWEHVLDYVIKENQSSFEKARYEIINSNTNVVFSSEDFLNPFCFKSKRFKPCINKYYEKLDRMFSIICDKRQVILLIVIREQKSWLKSFLIECLKQGYTTTTSISIFWNGILGSNKSWVDNVLNYNNLYSNLSFRYPNTIIELIPYELLINESIDLKINSISYIDGKLNKGLKEYNAENKSNFVNNRAIFSKSEYVFIIKRRILQLLEQSLSFKQKLEIIKIFNHINYAYISKKGLEILDLDYLNKINFSESNKQLASKIVRLKNIGDYGYFS